LDDEYAASLHQHVSSTGFAEGAHPCRFREFGELEYSIPFALRFLPWLRKVFIVTNGQRPPESVLADSRVTWITHDQIIPSSDLPTFNRHAIEPHVVHIPGLAEHFITTADDWFVGRAIEKDWFFGVQGFGRFPHAVSSLTGDRRPVNNWTENLRHSNAALSEVYGPLDRKEFSHCPQIMRRSAWLKTLDRHDRYIRQTIGSKIRLSSNVIFRTLYIYDLLYETWGVADFSELQLRSQGDVCVADRKVSRHVSLRKNDKGLQAAFRELETNRPQFFCLNDDILTMHYESVKTATIEFLNKYWKLDDP
ncbi:MAG: hypothetical protein MI673_10770, partial [Thiotrichales bacterium]|nr:hypothetical protein [Thiotrichales bacterium]